MSKIKPGDRVRFVNENMEGIVTRVEGKTAGVTIEDDFEIPVLLSEILKIESVHVPAPKEVKASPLLNKDRGVYLAFDRENDTLLDLTLYNGNCDLLAFAFYEKSKSTYNLVKHGELEMLNVISLGRYSLEDFNNWPEFCFQLIQINLKGESLTPPISRTLHFTAKEFHASFKNCPFLGRQAYTFPINPELKNIDLQKLKERDFAAPPTPGPIAKPQSRGIVDLHADILLSPSLKYDPFSPGEIIDLQMQTFRKELEMAHVNSMKKIIFIHGVGNQFLKNKIIRELAQLKDVVSEFHDADALVYGGGATEVILR